MRCHDQNIDEAVTDYDSVEAVPLLAPDDDGGPKVDEGGDGQERGVGPGIGRGARLVDHLGAIGEQGEVAKEEEHPGVWRHSALVDSSSQTDGALGLYSSYKGGRGGHPLNSELRNTKQVHLHTPKD